MGFGAHRLLCTLEAAVPDLRGLEAPGHERGSVLALYSDDLLLVELGLPYAVCHCCRRLLHGRRRFPHLVFLLWSLESVAESYVRCIRKSISNKKQTCV